MSRKEFLRSTPADLRIRIQQFEKARKEEIHAQIQTQVELLEYQSWLSGLYVKMGVSSALFPKKSKYPEKPITAKKKNRQVEENPDVPKKSEAELKEEERYYELLIRKANANIAEKDVEKGQAG